MWINKKLQAIAREMHEHDLLTIEILKLWTIQLKLWTIQENRQLRAEQRQIEYHAMSMQLFKLHIETIERNAQAEKENKERMEKYVNPFLYGDKKTGPLPTDSIGE